MHACLQHSKHTKRIQKYAAGGLASLQGGLQQVSMMRHVPVNDTGQYMWQVHRFVKGSLGVCMLRETIAGQACLPKLLSNFSEMDRGLEASSLTGALCTPFSL